MRKSIIIVICLLLFAPNLCYSQRFRGAADSFMENYMAQAERNAKAREAELKRQQELLLILQEQAQKLKEEQAQQQALRQMLLSIGIDSTSVPSGPITPETANIIANQFLSSKYAAEAKAADNASIKALFESAGFAAPPDNLLREDAILLFNELTVQRERENARNAETLKKEDVNGKENISQP